MDRAVVLSLEFAVMCEACQNMERFTQSFFYVWLWTEEEVTVT